MKTYFVWRDDSAYTGPAIRVTTKLTVTKKGGWWEVRDATQSYCHKSLRTAELPCTVKQMSEKEVGSWRSREVEFKKQISDLEKQIQAIKTNRYATFTKLWDEAKAVPLEAKEQTFTQP